MATQDEHLLVMVFGLNKGNAQVEWSGLPTKHLLRDRRGGAKVGGEEKASGPT